MIVTQIVVQNGQQQKSHIVMSVRSLAFLNYIKLTILKWLQMKIVYRVIATNVVLKKMGIINCEQCTFCDEKDSIEHFLWQCYFTRRFWRLSENLISTNCETACNIKITENLVLFGIDSTAITDKIFDLIILLA